MHYSNTSTLELGATVALSFLPLPQSSRTLAFLAQCVTSACRTSSVMAPAGPSVRSNARLSVALRDRPGHTESRARREIDLEVYVAQDAYGLQRVDIVRVLPVAFNLCRLAEPRPRIRECLTPRVYLASQSNAISHVA